MSRICFSLVVIVCSLLGGAAGAQSDEEVRSRIASLHGDAEGFGDAFERLQEAFRSGDADAVAEFGAYPLRVEANGEVYDVLEARDLVENFDRLVMAETQDLIVTQDYGALFVNSEGVMFGDGELWMSAVCEDDACGKRRWAIIAINN
jgi:hypothetical protein